MFERFSNIKKVHNPAFPNRWEWGVQIRPFLGVQNPPFLGGVLGPPRGGARKFGRWGPFNRCIFRWECRAGGLGTISGFVGIRTLFWGSRGKLTLRGPFWDILVPPKKALFGPSGGPGSPENGPFWAPGGSPRGAQNGPKMAPKRAQI